MPQVRDKSEFKKGASVSDEFALFNLSSVGYINLPFGQNKDYQSSVNHLDILK